MSDFLFNPARLTFHVPNLVSGLLLRGKKGAPRGLVGNGDCILLDGALGLVGIADGTDRSPQASRRFLATLAREGAARWARGGPSPGAPEFLDLATSVLEQFDYNERTTFLCLIPLEWRRFLFLAGGDSLLLQVDPKRNTVALVNKPNMGFTGRSREIVDFGGLEVADHELLVLATDGLWDLQGGGQETLGFLAETLGAGPLDVAPRRLVEEMHPAFCPETGKPYDDMALVLVRPFERGAFPHRVLLGGTDDRMESLYERRLKRKALPDTDLPLPDGSPSFWILPDALENLRL